MFTFKDILFGSITHTAIHGARYDNLKSKNLILSKDIFKIVGTENAMFYVRDNHDIQEIQNAYKYNHKDLRPSDIVLDVGAGIGTFSLNIHNEVSHIYAIEHNAYNISELRRNIALNNVENIDILEESDILLNQKLLNQKSESDILLNHILLNLSGNIDFMKIDFTKLHDFTNYDFLSFPYIMNIRRIEAKIHNSHQYNQFKEILTDAGFNYTINNHYLSAKNRYIN